jgi:hypothetical protein
MEIMVQIKRFDGKEYRGPIREFPNKHEAEMAAKEMRESGLMLVRIERKRETRVKPSFYYYVLWLRSKARG